MVGRVLILKFTDKEYIAGSVVMLVKLADVKDMTGAVQKLVKTGRLGRCGWHSCGPPRGTWTDNMIN